MKVLTLGLQIYMGTLSQKCVRQWPYDDEEESQLWGNFRNIQSFSSNDLFNHLYRAADIIARSALIRKKLNNSPFMSLFKLQR